MEICYFPQIHTANNPYGKPIRFAFCSKRLALLILKKSQEGNWVFPYFYTARNKLLPGFFTTAVSNRGLLIMTTEK